MTKAIGYMTVEINEKGEPRIKKDDKGNELLTFLDVEYEVITDIRSEALEMIRASIPKELKDCLALFTFKYEGRGGNGLYQDDYEDWLVVESQIVLKEKYKEFYRNQVTYFLKLAGKESKVDFEEWKFEEDEKEIEMDLNAYIEDWEELYDEDFTPSVIEKVAVSPLQFFGN